VGVSAPVRVTRFERGGLTIGEHGDADPRSCDGHQGDIIRPEGEDRLAAVVPDFEKNGNTLL
jgi:hypothetical protein